MATYPTPPPTISPKNDFNPSTGQAHQVPAQDSYFYSTPNSPVYSKYWDVPRPSHSSAIAPFQQSLHSSIVPYTHTQTQSQYYPPQMPTRPRTPSQKSSTGRNSPRRPLYSSPTNPIPTPYSSSRPKPRVAFRKRVLAKLKSWIQSLARWTKENPIKAGLITFLPVLAAAGAAKMLGGLGKMLGKGKSEADKVISANRKVIEQSRKAKKDGKKVWGWGLDEFVDFNCSRGGPLDGILKILQMWVTHICRVSPSMIPRTMAVILDLYFLELEKPLN